MIKKVVKTTGILLGIAGMVLFILYLGLSVYYKDGFSYGTWINGVYCTGKSVEEVNLELLTGCSYEGLTIQDRNGNTYQIPSEEIDFSFDFTESLQLYMSKQNPYLWIDHILQSAKKRTLNPVTGYDHTKCDNTISQLPVLIKDIPVEERTVAICKTNQGYQLVNDRVQVLNRQKMTEAIHNSLENFQTYLNLEEAGCYEDLELSQEMQQTLAIWNKIQEFQNCGIVYQMGEEQVAVDASVTADWIVVNEDGSFAMDEQGNLMMDEEGPAAFISKLAETYDTVGKARSFQTTHGETVIVEGGIYGNELDQKTETAYLREAFLNRVSEVHTPVYSKLARKQGKDDIGSTYIEIDMTNQMLYYYVEGSLKIGTPVVTGNISLRRGTPTGVNYVYNKQKNRVLRGPGYASPVKFWIPVKGGIGIHDSSWRSEYGGEIYKTAGSHGCINTPLEEVTKLYDMVEIGTPVIMFYQQYQQ